MASVLRYSQEKFLKKGITVLHNLTCQGISCIIQPYWENLEATYFICLLAFTPGPLVFSVTSGCLKFPGQKTHWFLASSSQKFVLCLTAPAFIFQSIHSICVIQVIFSAMVYFWFCFIFSLRGISTIASPSATVVSDCFTFIPGLQSQWIAVVECIDDVSKHKGPWSWWQVYTWGLGCLFVEWSCQNRFALIVPKFKFQPGEPRKKSCFTSKAPRTATPRLLFKLGSIGCLHSKIGGTLSTLLSQLPLLSP